MFKYRAKLAELLAAAADELLSQPNEPIGRTRYVDLAPTDKADPSGVYAGALADATGNPRVMNIALTGPYGSGKSSIIQSFLRSYKQPVLQISLASFLPEVTSTSVGVGRQEIERSILQQMLYGADANRLPLSRFKRIQSPGRWAAFASLFLVLGLLSCWHLIEQRDEIISGAYFIPFSTANWLNFSAIVLGALFSWRLVHHIYISSFGISLKSISLKDIEITPNAAAETSILNRHLDEIIYFFQSTKYDLVVIEDLDRFDNADIFISLREINALINANAGVKRTVRFLYALRDDMFVSTDRTKFFEFIIPVIPIINSSNSIDKVIEQGKRLSLDSRLNPQFLREASRYLNDLRLIQNIFNEYAIYVANLETDGENNLDANKLLAVLIYKNVFPRDFEKLHRGNGILAEILHGHDRYIAVAESECIAEISRLEALIDLGEKQLPTDVNELRRIYAMALIELMPAHYSQVGTDRNNLIPMTALASHQRLEEFISAPHVFAANLNGQLQQVPLSGFQATLSLKTFVQRKEEVEWKSSTFKDSTVKRILELRSKLSSFRMMKFSEIIRDNAGDIDGLFDQFGENAALARFLVLEGFLDDTYYQYTSLFHSGRLSPSDNKFLIQIRSFKNPDADFQIDNPKEVIAAMRDEDFSRNYVLNVKIVDCLLSDPASYATQTTWLLDFIASDFDSCENFFESYYAGGVAVSALIAGLARRWPEFVPAAIASSANLTHVARIMSHLPDAELKGVAAKHPALSEFVGQALPQILALAIDFPPDRLQLLDLEVASLAAIEAYPGFIRVLYKAGLYKLSVDNLSFIFRSILDLEADSRPNEQNYTLVLEAGSEPLLTKVEGRFAEYLDNVLLRLPDNRLESVSAIERVIGRDGLQSEAKISFLKMQTTLLPNLERVPVNLHAALFEIERIEPTWENCLYFLGSDSYDAQVLTDFLNKGAVMSELGREPVPGSDAAIPLRNFIIENDALDDEAYAAYVKALPRKFKAFPSNLSSEKTKILVDQDRVNFSAANLSHLSGDLPLGVAFVAKNIADFFKVESECGLDDDFREELLQADISDTDRLKILRSMDLALLNAKPSRAAIVGSIIARTGAIEGFGADATRSLILHSRPFETQVSLFNLLHEKLDDDQVRDLLLALPDPLPDIKPGWAMPRLKGSEGNLRFVEWLKVRGFISSWKQGGFFDDDIRINLFRK